ncbi:uncharacterized protein MELLADRAFT_101851 [Melampsora larici-populina 98AG31]|uniref:Uncharacterized protein n=1 Tax=Melampsora larici-populina (strain 98AG31 / pathotype 3-4-7) TaxID=747676 RepID=F4R540_MELLP|nr:uncharacterized protein MELLADRAFT_101851 [Melampsora larici-populina 98AG31]EGG11989.1 hypothetical protein MELLADRAFT_101851 [Melampsora larici-populina 98AG31]
MTGITITPHCFVNWDIFNISRLSIQGHKYMEYTYLKPSNISRSWNHSSLQDFRSKIRPASTILKTSKHLLWMDFWAPHLTHLHIRVLEEPDRFPREDLSDYDPKCEQLTLPALTHLKIWPHSKCHYIHYFSNCKELYQLTFYDFIRREWDDELSGFFDLIPDESFQVINGLSDFIINNEFPKLRWIILPVEHGNFSLDPIAASALFPLEEFFMIELYLTILSSHCISA